MGGKTKQVQRTKNNAKPSNSGRSAELLGAAVPAFVGFSAHSDLGMIPFAPGFTTTDKLPETFDSSISSQFQLVLRKMSKKDPITKVKALQEFTDLLQESDVDIVKSILPLWPKFYHNLANDVDHRVRESAQNVQNLIVSKCRKAVAPYLKQLTPVWLGSQFDNYPPAASVAASSFQTVFAPNKLQEVLLFCQQEILEYIVRNLTFHTPATLSSAKSSSPEDAENKYQRIVSCSLKLLSFFLEKTAGCDLTASVDKIQSLLAHQKFWTFAKHRTAHIKSAWFELLYNVLQYHPEMTDEIKGQLIPMCFQNLDESEPLIVPHVWGCILLLQNTFDDWYKSLNFKKNVQPKLSTFLRNACDGNAEAVCPNLLPFLSKITQESLQEISLDEFHRNFFSDMKEAITSSKIISKSDCSSLTAAYYECIRFILQRLNANTISPDSEQSQYILNELINNPIRWACSNQGVAVKYIFLHTSALVAYWDENKKSELYAKMLEGFWSALSNDIENKPLNEIHVENTITLINNLFWANPPLQSHKVKFAKNDNDDDDEDEVDGRNRNKSKALPSYVQDELKTSAVELVRLCLANMLEHTSLQFEAQIRSLTKLYPDAQFYADISKTSNIEETLNSFATLLCTSAPAELPSEVIVEIVFEILSFMQMDAKLLFINKLLQTKKPALQQCLLQRLLSYPMCIEPEVRQMLAEEHIIEIILHTANEVLIDDSKEKFNLLHKCFFQTDSGDILINQKTVDGILEIISKPLSNPQDYDAMIDPCGSFIAQIMPVVCSKNSSEKAQKDIFIKLFQFTIDQVKSDDLSEDTLWEITTCWQDALSSEDIVMDDTLLEKCTQTISNRLNSEMTCSEIHNVADLTSSLILCSTENHDEEDKRYEMIDSYLEVLFKPKDEHFDETLKNVAQFCTFLEALNGKIAVNDLPPDAGKDVALSKFFKRSLLNLTALMKMVCGTKVFKVEKPVDDEECTEDYCDPNETLLKKWTEKMYDITLELIKIAAQAESLVTNCLKVNSDQMVIMLEFSEKVKLLLQGLGEEQVEEIKDRLLKDAAFNDVAATRAIPFLIQIPQYAQFEESALILLIEELTEYLLNREALASYVNLLQFTLEDLSSKAINQENQILRRSADIWHKCAIFQLLIRNNFNQETNEISDRQIIALALNYITEVSENQKKIPKEQLLHNTDVSKQDFVCVTRAVEYINLLIEVLERFPYELTIKNWDAIRLGLSSWVLSVAKSIDNYKNSKVSIFVTAVYKLHKTFAHFMKAEKTKSSTEMLSSVIDEWENLFSSEVNIVLFKRFYNFASEKCDDTHSYSTCYLTMLNEIAPAVQCLDYAVIYKFSKVNQEFTLQDLVKFLLGKISSPVHSLRITCLNVLIELSNFFIANDKEMFEKTTDLLDAKAGEKSTMPPWHFLSRFKDHLEAYESAIVKYLDEFSFKLAELQELKPIDREEGLTYLLLWECVLSVCANAPVELRSIYTSWLTENKFDQKFLHFLFRAMPVEILKNYDSKLMNNDLFKSVNWSKSKSENIQIDKYACQVYSMALSKLPAVVRKWWNGSYSRQKVFVDKLTTNFVSEIICHDELSKLGKINDKDKHNNMQVTVRTSMREVYAVYNIDEARMELIIALAPNYPLGGVKVESSKQIGGRDSKRNIAMLLTIFITHQNGSIFDGLSLWKNNLDKKFEGVEECYVCYTVIHQDTCQLPKLTCKTCRKKFHSPCLYKWFTTSSKSTCPLCRNIF